MILPILASLADTNPALTEAYTGTNRVSLSRQVRHHRTQPAARDTKTAPFSRPANWVFIPESPGKSRVSGIAVGGDFNGDGLADVAIGDAAHADGRGRVLVFCGSPQGLGAKPDAIIEGAEGQRDFGLHVQMIGDVDGDGLDDLLISHKANSSASDVAHVFQGSLAGPPRDSKWEVPPGSVPVGDVNGDGFDDVASSAADPTHERAVLVFHGSPHGLSLRLDWIAYSEQPGSNFGHDIARAGDVNGDGYDDLLIGAMQFNGRFRRGGKAYLYLGSSQGLSSTPVWAAEYPLPTRKDVDEAYEQFFSWGLGPAGDVNHDGFDDVIVGACFADHGDLNEGLAFVYYGSKKGLGKAPNWWAESNHPHTLFGASVASVGDVNGDGIDDIAVGLPEVSDGQQTEGAAAVYHGSRSGLAPYPAWLMESDHSNERFGEQVAGAGDLNGDGYADVLVFGPDYKGRGGGSEGKCGRVVVCYGGPGGLPFSNSWNLEKPFLTALQQEMEHLNRRFGSVVYWGPWLLVLTVVSAGFLTVQNRLRQRLKAEIEKNRLLTLEQERTRLARDLHDELGGHLARLSQSGEASLAAFAEAARGVATGIERTIWSLHPGHRSMSDLACGLTDLADNLLRDTAIRLRFDIPLDLPATELPAETLDAVYRASQEALNNVRKHSRASQVTVSLACRVGQLQVVIADDGVGLPNAKPPVAKPGLGLAGMATRLKEVGGTWAAEANTPSGLIIRLTVPCS